MVRKIKYQYKNYENKRLKLGENGICKILDKKSEIISPGEMEKTS